MPTAETLVAEADRHTASGNILRAAELLMQASEIAPDDASLWLKLAALERATGRLEGALAAVHRALSISPLDFTALLMRASLLDRMNQSGAAEAWSHALAQRPTGELPAHLRAVVATAEARVEKWTVDREKRIKSAMRTCEEAADPEQLKRLQRFRSNVLRRTRHYHSEPTHFHYPALAEREFYPVDLFPWLKALEEGTDLIAAELRDLMDRHGAELVPYIQYADHLPLDQWRELNKNRDWSAIHLWQNGKSVDANAAHCPRTIELLRACEQPQIAGASPNAMFSILAPHTSIPPHVGVNNARLVCHLPLVVPEGCWFRVGAETRFWKKGEALVFDDTIEHEAANPTDQLRVVLIFDTWHPDLSLLERQGVKALIEADDIPGSNL